MEKLDGRRTRAGASVGQIDRAPYSSLPPEPAALGGITAAFVLDEPLPLQVGQRKSSPRAATPAARAACSSGHARGHACPA